MRPSARLGTSWPRPGNRRPGLGSAVMRIGSLFSGIGGLELGLERAGVGEVLWQVECNTYCRAVLARHWPNATRYEDVRHVGKATLAPVDVLCGGFPCQDVSLAGTRRGLSGPRSGLWAEYERIVHELRPRFVVVENVPGLLRRGMDEVIRGLASGGYTVEGTRIRAEDVGAPHRRERLFLLAYTGRESLRDEPKRDQLHAAKRGHLEPPHDGQAGPMAEGPPGGAWTLESGVDRVAHGVPHRVDRLRTLGNAVVPQCAAIVGRRILDLAHCRDSATV